jgi:hypothetical protein
VEPRTLLREDEVALPCSWITAPDYCNKSDELRAEEESFCVSKSVRPGAISLPLDLETLTQRPLKKMHWTHRSLKSLVGHPSH